MNFHKTVKTIKDLLDNNNYWYEYFEHEPVRTSEEASKVRGNDYSISQGAKALIIRYKPRNKSEKGFAMLVVPGDTKFDKKKAQAVLDTKDISFATEEQVSQLTDGIKVGGVPPFGNIFNLQVFLEKKLLENDKIIFNAGDKQVSIAIYTKDYLKLVEPKIVNIV